MKVTNRQLSKQLKEAGFTAKGIDSVWVKDLDQDKRANTSEFAVIDKGLAPEEVGFELLYDAPSADELADILPAFILVNKELKFLYMWKDDKGLWRVTYCSSKELGGDLSTPAPKYQIDKEPVLADALGKMWLWLKENKYL